MNPDVSMSVEKTISAPAADEYAEFYAGYVRLASGVDLQKVLRGQVPALRKACSELGEDDALARYAPGKWSVKQVLGHLVDSERVFAYRLFRIGRGDATPLASFDENPYVEAGNYDARPLASLLDELNTCRAATLHLVDAMSPAAWERRGTASGQPVTARAIAHILAGHVEHHVRLLRDRYGVAVPPTDAD
jgi:uncharacterized damage-inducible protein DinB